jgi:hypothetical protein
MNPLIWLKKATPPFLIALLITCPDLSSKPQAVTPAPDGDYSGSNTAKRQTGIFSPAGGGWNIVPSPNTGSPHNYFYGVKAIASNDVWAVGGYGNLTTHAQQLIQHWNGQNWTVAPTPTLPPLTMSFWPLPRFLLMTCGQSAAPAARPSSNTGTAHRGLSCRTRIQAWVTASKGLPQFPVPTSGPWATPAMVG